MVEVKITNEQKVKVTLAPKTATGNPATLDGKPSWEVTEGDATVAVDEDGMGAFLISGDSASESKIMVSADADLGEGVETVSQEISLVVTLANASDLGLSVGTPEAK